MIPSPRISSVKSLLLLFFCIGFRAFGQFSAATVAGVVQDSSRAAITDAKLKLINTQTGAENDSTTSPQGGFLLAGIIPGGYTLQIECDGFATTQVNGITLNIGDTKNLLIRMKIGAVTETVNVDASGLTLNRTDATVSTVVDRKHWQLSHSNRSIIGEGCWNGVGYDPGALIQSVTGLVGLR